MWDWADKQPIHWHRLHEDDYDFGGWAKTESPELLSAGCLYEYARESHTFRCYLALRLNKPAAFRGIPPVMEFKGDSAYYIHLVDSGWEAWLKKFGDELIANRSFAELLRNDQMKLQASLKELPSLSTIPKAIELAGRYSADHPGSQIVEIQVFWRYRNDEIGEEMKRLAAHLRPDEWKEPERRGTGKETSVVSFLDGLSAMRLASYYPKSTPSDMIRRQRRQGRGGTDTVVSKFDCIRLNRILPESTKRKILGELTQNEFERYAARGRRQFARWFPFGEAANAVTFAQRDRGRR